MSYGHSVCGKAVSYTHLDVYKRQAPHGESKRKQNISVNETSKGKSL